MALPEVVAVIAVRNEQAYLGNLLRYLKANGVKFAIIDNQSGDDTPAIIRRTEYSSHLVDVKTLPFHGSFNLQEQLEAKMALTEGLPADWIIHHDADEILHSFHEGETLQEAIARVDREGFNVVDFEEFVFLPLEQEYVIECDGFQPMKTYYHFRPAAVPRLMRAWKRSGGLSMTHSGGHALTGPSVAVAPKKMALRHYMFRNQSHAYSKYAERVFRSDELSRGWHRDRHMQSSDRFAFPLPQALHRLDDPASRDLRVDKPYQVHYWRW
jgi:Glycosyl transferase family 2